MLLDRAHEQASLDELLDTARRRPGLTFVITGEAGIGKSNLLEHAIESATDMEITHVSGAESEIGLSFTGLHRLLGPFLGGFDTLPASAVKAFP